MQKRKNEMALALSAIPVLSGFVSLACSVLMAWALSHPNPLSMAVSDGMAGILQRTPDMGETAERLAFISFFAMWGTFLLAWFLATSRFRLLLPVCRMLSRRHVGFAALAVLSLGLLPLLLLPFLVLFGEEPNYYYRGFGPLRFASWSMFRVHLSSPLYALSAFALAASAVAAFRFPSRPLSRLLSSVAAVSVFSMSALLSVRIGLFPPPDGFSVDEDTHHKSAVLSPVVNFFNDGADAFSLYGRYYEFVGSVARAINAAGLADPLMSIQATFVIAIFVSLSALALSVRVATGSWFPAVLALFSAIAFANPAERGILYLQTEPLRWLFPSLSMLAVASMARGIAARSAPMVFLLFLLCSIGLRWNLETGLSILFASSAASIPAFLGGGPRRLAHWGLASASGLVAGHVLCLSALWLARATLFPTLGPPPVSLAPVDILPHGAAASSPPPPRFFMPGCPWPWGRCSPSPSPPPPFASDASRQESPCPP